MRETVELRDYLGIIGKRFWLIMVITFVITIVTAILSYTVFTPIYEGRTDILVNKSDTNGLTLGVGDIDSNLKLIETYRAIIESPRIMDLVIKQMGNSIDMKTLLDKTKVDTIKDSQIISIVVEDPSQDRAVLIANTIATTFQKEVVKLLNINNVNILSPAEVNSEAIPVKPKPLLNTAIAFILGLVISIGTCLLRETLDTTLRSEKEVEQYLGVPLLATISIIELKEKKKAKRDIPNVRRDNLEETSI